MTIRYKQNKMYTDGKHFADIALKSTDAKPTEGIATGAVCVEADTGKKFMYDEGTQTWYEISAGGGGGGGGGGVGTPITITLAVDGDIGGSNNFDLLGYETMPEIPSDAYKLKAFFKDGDDYLYEMAKIVINPATETVEAILIKESFEVYVNTNPEETVVSGDAELVHNTEHDFYYVSVTGDCTITAKAAK